MARIPRGRVATYGQVAALAGRGGHARQVGYALHSLPEGSPLPWQRVINARGEVSERAHAGWAGYQRHLLEEEGVRFDARGRIDLARWGWDPDQEGAAGDVRCSRPARGARDQRRAPPAGHAGARRRRQGLPQEQARVLRPRHPGAAPRLPRVRQRHAELAAEDILRLAAALWRTPVFELRAFAVELLVRRRALLLADPRSAPALLDFLEDLLRRARTWAFVDWIATQLVAPLVERDAAPLPPPRPLDRGPRLLDPPLGDPGAPPALRRGEGDWARFVRYADSQLGEREFFIRKAIGWVLREVGKKRPELVRGFLAPRLDRVAGLTLREAIKYLPARDRRSLRRRP